MESAPALASACIRQEGSTKASGSTIIEMGEESSAIQTATSSKENSRTTNRTEKASIHGSMARSMKVSGKMDLKKAKECGKAFLEIPTSASGSRAKLMATGSTNGRTEIDTRANGKCV